MPSVGPPQRTIAGPRAAADRFEFIRMPESVALILEGMLGISFKGDVPMMVVAGSLLKKLMLVVAEFDLPEIGNAEWRSRDRLPKVA
jgi:hypothetical protein